MPVYFVQAGDDGPVKIGHAADVLKRLRGFETAHAGRLRLLGVVEGGAATERGFHERFAAHRVRGEWFRPVAEVLAAAEGGRAGAEALLPPPPPVPRVVESEPVDPATQYWPRRETVPARDDTLGLMRQGAKEADAVYQQVLFGLAGAMSAISGLPTFLKAALALAEEQAARVPTGDVPDGTPFDLLPWGTPGVFGSDCEAA